MATASFSDVDRLMAARNDLIKIHESNAVLAAKVDLLSRAPATFSNVDAVAEAAAQLLATIEGSAKCGWQVRLRDEELNLYSAGGLAGQVKSLRDVAGALGKGSALSASNIYERRRQVVSEPTIRWTLAGAGYGIRRAIQSVEHALGQLGAEVSPHSFSELSSEDRLRVVSYQLLGVELVSNLYRGIALDLPLPIPSGQLGEYARRNNLTTPDGVRLAWLSSVDELRELAMGRHAEFAWILGAEKTQWLSRALSLLAILENASKGEDLVKAHRAVIDELRGPIGAKMMDCLQKTQAAIWASEVGLAEEVVPTLVSVGPNTTVGRFLESCVDKMKGESTTSDSVPFANSSTESRDKLMPGEKPDWDGQTTLSVGDRRHKVVRQAKKKRELLDHLQSKQWETRIEYPFNNESHRANLCKVIEAWRPKLESDLGITLGIDDSYLRWATVKN